MLICFRFLPLIIFLFIFSDCSKENKVISDVEEKYYKTIITLNNEQKINRVDFYESNTLKYYTITNYKNGLVELKQYDSIGNLDKKSSYFLDSSGLAFMSVDTLYTNNVYYGKYVRNYKYDKGYKVYSKVIYSLFNNNKDTIISEMEYDFNVINGNVVSIYNGHCTETYQYSDIDNKLDLNSFLGEFNGKINSKLKNIYKPGCSYGPSTAPPLSSYVYELNADGYVILQVENYSSSYYEPYGNPKKEKRITTFEYKIE